MQSRISLKVGTGQTGHATLFNQWEDTLLFTKTSTMCSKIFHNGRWRRTEHCFFVFLLTDTNSTDRLGFHIISKKTFDVRNYEYYSLQGIHWGVWIFQTDRRGCGLSGMACKICDSSKLVPGKSSRRECMKISWNCTKQDWYHLLTSTGQESKTKSS